MDNKLLVRYPAAHKLPADIKKEIICDVAKSLADNPKAVEAAIRILFARQTLDEQRQSETKHDNGLGVKSCHGWRVAYYGRWLASGKSLTGVHLDKARKLASTYVKTQLFELAALKRGLVSDQRAQEIHTESRRLASQGL